MGMKNGWVLEGKGMKSLIWRPFSLKLLIHECITSCGGSGCTGGPCLLWLLLVLKRSATGPKKTDANLNMAMQKYCWHLNPTAAFSRCFHSLWIYSGRGVGKENETHPVSVKIYTSKERYSFVFSGVQNIAWPLIVISVSRNTIWK